jgi:group I intron endonuclease
MEFFREVKPPPIVRQTTLSGRLHRGLKRHVGYSDDWLYEALTWSTEKYKLKYGVRRTLVTIEGLVTDLGLVFAELPDKVISWSNFRQRLHKRGDLTSKLLRDAVTMSSEDWITHYGGGRRKGFSYEGDLYPSARGNYSSVTSFLKQIDRYGDRVAIQARLKRDWDIDDALTRPPIEREGTYSLVYVITQISSGLRYVGISVRGKRTRWREHLKDAFENDSNSPLHKNMRKAGLDDFCLDVIEERVMSSSELSERECFWIDQLETQYPTGFNLAKGGSIGRVEGRQISREGVTYQSHAAAARELANKTGLAEHVILKRLAADEPLPENARRHSKHPEAGSILFRKWLGLCKRAREGATGSLVPEWTNSYDIWKQDTAAQGMEELDFYRPDPDMPWGPKNFAWGSAQERVSSVHGKGLSVLGKWYPSRTAACRDHGIGKGTFEFRLKRGMSVEEALTAPLGATSRKGENFEFEGEIYRSMTAASKVLAKRHGISPEKARDRIRRFIPTARWASMSN